MNRFWLFVIFLSAIQAKAQLINREVKSEQTSNVSLQTATENEAIQSQDVYLFQRRNLNHLAMPKVSIVNPVFQQVNVNVPSSTALPSSFEITTKIGMDRKQAVAFINIPQYVKKTDGSIEKLVSYELVVDEAPSSARKTSGNRTYALNSVLSSGKFYKVSLSQQGVYKVDYNFIKNSLGVDPATINPANIRLYGNGGELLSEDNGAIPADDLVENSIEVFDGGDGQFNAGDYFLFYANGPHSILKDSINKSFYHAFNIYSERSFYFINFDKGAGKRIATNTTSLTPNVNVNSFNEFQFYEKDSINLGKFGKTWWGDEFSDQPGRLLTRNYAFSVPSLDISTPLTIRTRFGAVSYSGSSYVTGKANGNVLFANTITSVGQSYSDSVSKSINIAKQLTLTSDNINIEINFTKGGATSAGYLDFIEINARRALNFAGYLNFADWNSVGSGNIASYQIANATTNLRVWDITNPLSPERMNGSLSGTTYTFSQAANSLHRFVATDGAAVLTPAFVEITPNQNLHKYVAQDYIIISPEDFKKSAEALAAHHKAKRGLRTLIVTPQEIYNEFSSGSQDVSAIRDFLKMYYDIALINEIPKYVLFMGDASYDYKNRVKNNSNWVPTYETYESDSKIFGYCTDDFFGFLDDNENINVLGGSQINMVDIGIGRFPINSNAASMAIIYKLMNYDSPKSFGPWKNNMTFNADDEDSGTHLVDGEIMSSHVNDSMPVYNNSKIYVDGFVQQSTPAGPRTPDANKAVLEQIYNGTFLMNYNGHGGPLGWCEERIFSMDDVNLMSNINKLPLFITATCDFAPYDDPSIVSAGEILINKGDGGAVALMTTTRLVYQDENRDMNLNYMKAGFKQMSNGQFPALGDAYRISKNLRYDEPIGVFEASNFRKFILLGDPALPLAFPKHKIVTDSVNGISVSVAYDTLKALGKYTVSGHLSDQNGNLLTDFNGTVYPTIFDKPKRLSTLQNDPNSPKKDYFVQNNAIYKGKASVRNGKFTYTFVVPKDINYAIAKGKISYYAENGIEDANGYDKEIFIGGSNPNAEQDNVGPVIKAFLNNDKFVNGGITPANATLLVKLSDDNGINYTGNSIGHDITAILDGDPQNTYVLNNFFESDIDNYKQGSIKFPLSGLSVGNHTLRIKAWDISNNSAEATLDFVVVSSEGGQLANVYNYPNPFTTKTNFMFEHNMPNQNLYVSINIYSVSGKMVKTIRTVVNSEGTRADNIEWDGLDEFGDKLAKGVYVYKLAVKSQSGFSDSVYQKLILLN